MNRVSVPAIAWKIDFCYSANHTPRRSGCLRLLLVHPPYASPTFLGAPSRSPARLPDPSIPCPRCAIKVDFQKAYDSNNWNCILDTIHCFHFPSNVIQWIRTCITTPSFSISINGELNGFFRGAKPKGLGRLLLQIVPLLVCHWYGCARFSFEKFGQPF